MRDVHCVRLSHLYLDIGKDGAIFLYKEPCLTLVELQLISLFSVIYVILVCQGSGVFLFINTLFLSLGFLGWAAYSSSFLHILWFVSGNIVSSQQTKQ